MEEYKQTWREKALDIMFDTTFGSIACFVICTVLFVLMFGVGYLGVGVSMLIYIRSKAKKKNVRVGEGGFGVVFLWPIAIMLIILDKD